MNDIYMINGSPKVKKDNNSQYFIDELSNLLNSDTTKIQQASVNNCCKEEIYPKLLESKIIIFAAPLYVDCLPASFLSFLIGLDKYIKQAKISSSSFPRVYSIFNCGFYEGHQNRIALDIMKNFCKKVGFTWRFGIGIGAGEFIGDSKSNIPINSKMKKDTFNALMEIKNDIESNNNSLKNNIFSSPKMPRFIFKLAANRSWIVTAKVNKLKKKDLYMIRG